MAENLDALIRRDDAARARAELYHRALEIRRRVHMRKAMFAQFHRPAGLRRLKHIKKLDECIERYRPDQSTPTGLAIHLSEQLEGISSRVNIPHLPRPSDAERLGALYETADYSYRRLVDTGYPLPHDLCRRSDENLAIHLRRMVDACTRWRKHLKIEPQGGGAMKQDMAGSEGEAKPQVVDENAAYSPTDLAERFGLQQRQNALRQRLERYRKQNHNGWIENPDRKPREPKYLYYANAVTHILDELSASSETSSE